MKMKRGERRDLTKAIDYTPYTNRKLKKSKVTTQKRDQTFRLHNDCGPTYGQLE